MQTCAADLRQFIVDNFLFGQLSEQFAFTDEDSFLDRGIIDSTGILELVAFLEQKYKITIGDDELIPENFDSITRVAKYVGSKLQPSSGVYAQ
jgi:acyl carrier protein